jgi:hypothetical protein
MSVKSNINFFNERIGKANCRLIAVSKTKPIELLQEAYTTGQRLFGENKVQELTAKHEALPSDIEWHMIGHLQSNKVKYIAPFVSLIHSVDTLKLLEEINKQGKKINRAIPCLLQVHIAQEETKFGFDADEIKILFNGTTLQDFAFADIKGLMGMASLTEDQEKIRSEFKGLKILFDEMKKVAGDTFNELSMGMSSDYTIAIEEGSTLIRIGTALFGGR